MMELTELLIPLHIKRNQLTIHYIILNLNLIHLISIFSQIAYSISNDEADSIEKLEIENATLELVCTTPQLRNVITQDNNII